MLADKRLAAGMSPSVAQYTPQADSEGFEQIKQAMHDYSPIRCSAISRL